MKVLFRNKDEELNVLLKENDVLSDFKVVDSNLEEVNLYSIQGKKIILSVPSVDTGVCSLELSKFIHFIEELDVKLISVSMDLPFALRRWCQNNSENILATSDFRYHDFSKVTGLLMKNGLFSRSVLLLDKNNKIVYLEIVENTHSEPNYQQVINCLKAGI